MEQVKRRNIKVNSFLNYNVCVDVSDIEDSETVVHFFDTKENKFVKISNRGHFLKCLNCVLRGKKMCEKIACLSIERKDGKSIILQKI